MIAWKFEVFKHEDGGWRWRLIQQETLIIAEASQSFSRRSDAKHAALTVRREIGDAPIDTV